MLNLVATAKPPPKYSVANKTRHHFDSLVDKKFASKIIPLYKIPIYIIFMFV